MLTLKRMKIGGRLNTGFAAVLVIAVATSLLAIWQLRGLADQNRTLLETPLQKERLISGWYGKIDSAIRRTSAIAKSSDGSLAAFFQAESAASTKDTTDLQQRIQPLIHGDAERARFVEALESRKTYLASRDRIARLKTDGKIDDATRVFDQTFIPAANRYEGLVLELLKMQRVEIDRTAREISDHAARSVVQLIGLTFALLVFGIVFAWWLTSSITRPLGSAVSTAHRVASGDLTGHIDSDLADETGDLLRSLEKMKSNLSDIVTRVRSGTDSIVTASSQIAAGNLDLSSRTEEQAAALGETASSMEELTSTVKQTADNARQAHQLANDASTVAVSGGAAVKRVIETMSAISASSERIGDIVGVIDGIAFQTNILALNAAVEAARAGEQGRGFAVVASEVRTLAQRSATAAKEIKELIGNSTRTVSAGNTLVIEAGQTMVDVVSRVQSVTRIVSQILTATEAQSTGLGQVNDAVLQIDQVTQQNAALVEEAAAAASSLQMQASELAATVSAFKLTSA